MSVSIIVDGVEKALGGRRILRDISLRVERGGLVALLGPSGCGKTTLLRTIAGFERPDVGSISIGGSDVTDLPLRAREIGFVHQHDALFPHLTVGENVGFSLAVRHRPGNEIAHRVAELLELVELEGYEKRMPRELSGGQRQRVALIRALAAQPKVLLLDEPFSALDVRVRADLRIRLRELHERNGVTTIIVTHDPDEAMELADRLIVMNAGRIEQEGTPREIYRDPRTSFAMRLVGDATVFRDERRETLVRPHDVRIEHQPFAHSKRGLVERVISLGPRTRVAVALDDGQRVVAELYEPHRGLLDLEAGMTVFVAPERPRVFAVTGTEGA
ncbi:MAG TPA: ABC transporter ATP-binding protein [Candidatus Baltobacteraceae bacterium]|jgi:sulfate transport system ATP-binding protein|nr:ABC transporter ATP-binding protein [Candidatus Baltobacteraceae bacterium]